MKKFISLIVIIGFISTSCAHAPVRDSNGHITEEQMKQYEKEKNASIAAIIIGGTLGLLVGLSGKK
jgi:hypothetical protein